ncbi:unnamed protein product [Rangifer tarandus platyrhynchus]|uniref:Uncharacterized protein n=2 Tax=Rangifer tarandus platyrhynchus TaxID=3082113 RepID=A0ABN8Z3P5_RANTA|nr:unnamed protein product [Rangifer tarandus platyrhynchus]CAI9703607.1 unnamed protein product [Rangifer tarandus platyrhynchus]
MSGSSTFGRWSSPFTLNFLPSRGLSCSSQLITSRDQADLPEGAHGSRRHACAELLTVHPPGIVVARGWRRGESPGQGDERPLNRRRLRDQPARSLGSGMEAWMELGKVPEEKEPAEGMAPVAVAIFSPDR